jgi:hypothetical protein
MYVVIQRVIAPTTRETGINAFLYVHPGRRWEAPPGDIPGSDPGQLVRQRITVTPNGNLVRSNMEVVAPDDIEVPLIRRHLMAFADRAQFNRFPWQGIEGPCAFRVDMVPQLVAAGWSREVRALATAGAQLVEGARQASGSPARSSPR